MEEQDILNRWTEYCTELYNHTTTGNDNILKVPPTETKIYPILRKEVKTAVKALK